MNDIKKMGLPFLAGVVVALVVCYFMGGMNVSSSFNLGTKQ